MRSRPFRAARMEPSPTSLRRGRFLLIPMSNVEYTAMLLGATGNVGGHILHLLVQSPLWQKVIVVTRRHVAELAHPRVQQVVVNMDKLEEELAPYARGVDIALAAFGVGKGSARMPDDETPCRSGALRGKARDRSAGGSVAPGWRGSCC